ncbi:hypothetical protein IID62_01090 [candidate division KSB1 bacterium]|nr:hypothetical protein [candidate division KSB1 bacterium]
MRSSIKLILLLILLVSCSESENYTVKNIFGIRYVHNLAPENAGETEPQLSLRLIRKFGGTGVARENYNFTNIRDIARDSNGNIYILDRSSQRIRKYDANGEYRDTIWKKGQFPGNMKQPKYLEFDRHDNLFVWDAEVNNLHVFEAEGLFLATINLNNPPTIQGFHILSTGDILLNSWDLTIPQLLPGEHLKFDNDLSQKIKIYDVKGEKRVEFLSSVDFGSPIANMNGNNIYTAVDEDDNIYVSFFMQNRVEKYRANGKQVFVADRFLDYWAYSTVVAADEGGSQRIILDTGTFVSESLGLDNKGRIWVSTYLSQGETVVSYSQHRDILSAIPGNLVFHVFGNDGVWLDIVESPLRFNRVRFFGDRVYFIDQTKLTLYEYQIVEKN